MVREVRMVPRFFARVDPHLLCGVREKQRQRNRSSFHSGVTLNSRTQIALPKHGPTDGADSMPE